MYMSSIPDEPLCVGCLKFVKVNWDSFVVEQFKAGEQYGMAYQEVFLLKDIEFDELGSVQPPMVLKSLVNWNLKEAHLFVPLILMEANHKYMLISFALRQQASFYVRLTIRK